MKYWAMTQCFYKNKIIMKIYNPYKNKSIIAKLVNEGKEYTLDPIQLDGEKIIYIEIFNINKYYFSFTWENIVGVGTLEVLATNDKVNYSLMKYADDQDMILNIDTANGSSHIADYIGHNSKYLCFKFSGFIDGYITGTINFI